MSLTYKGIESMLFGEGDEVGLLHSSAMSTLRICPIAVTVAAVLPKLGFRTSKENTITLTLGTPLWVPTSESSGFRVFNA